MNSSNASFDDAIVYQLDANDRVCFVNDAWNASAAAYGFPELGRIVLGTPLNNFIGSGEVAQVYYNLLSHIRATGRAARFAYRCDCQEWLRDMQMEVRLLENAVVEFRSTLVSARLIAGEQRAEFVESQLEIIRVCSWCRSVATDVGWIAIGDAIEQLDIFQLPTVPATSHGICPACEERLMAEFERE